MSLTCEDVGCNCGELSTREQALCAKALREALEEAAKEADKSEGAAKEALAMAGLTAQQRYEFRAIREDARLIAERIRALAAKESKP